MQELKDFSEWMNVNSTLSDSSIYKYSRAVNTISNDMKAQTVIYKSLFEMDLVELDIAISNILKNEFFYLKNRKGNNMYSNALKQFRFFYCDTMLEDNSEKRIEEEIKKSVQLSETEKQVIVKARVGQGQYRTNLMNKYGCKCVVTGISKPRLLIASHIKPWAVCNNDERVDTENGLLLCPNMDKLFDCGLITFGNDGKMVVSSFVGEENANKLNINNEKVIDLRATQKLLEYLEYHRDVLFVK